MTLPDHASEMDDRILEEAAGRVVRAHTEGEGALRPEDQQWLDASFENRRAHHAATSAWAAMRGIGSTPEIIALRQEALGEAARAAQSRWRVRVWPQALSRKIAAAMALLIIGATTAYVLTRPSAPEVYETALGERRVITLADDSKVSLDESTRVSVRYRRGLRDLELVKGQAEFDVAPDPLRPFSVSSGGRRVVATGTLFNVDLLEGQLIVTLLHGGVVVGQEPGAPGAADVIHLGPSERLVVERASGAAHKAVVDPADVEAWKVGKLVFEAERLDRAVERVNRYAKRKIVLAVGDQEQAPVSGVFNIGDSHAFAGAVSAQLQLRSEVRTNTVVLYPR